ncbi:putative secondary metabolism biosynthetic enzyme [Claviceps purpurea]|nr:putative secondary metabolism biosynthetic enzyme [Claviceps purpurea]
MMSKRCLKRNQTLIPELLKNHGALLYGDTSVVDLSTAENQLLMEELLPEFQAAFDASTWSSQELAYSEGVGGCPKVRGLIADLVNSHFQPHAQVDKSHIVLGAGGCFALNALIEAICDPGDGILIAAPYWPGLDLSISVHNDAKAVVVRVPHEDFFRVESIRHYSKALLSAPNLVKAMIICNPHNPLGRNYPRETLQAIVDFCAERQIHLISDEVYALSQHVQPTSENPSAGFVSALSLDASHARGLVHVVYSLSKDFGCNGIRLGAFISQDNKAVVMSGALSTHCQTSTMATLVAQKIILTDGNIQFVNTYGRGLLKSAYTVMEEFLNQHRIEFVSAECGMYIFAKLCGDRTSVDDEWLFQAILRRNGLVLSAGTDYHCKTPGWFRICYGCDREKLRHGLDRLRDCLQEFGETEFKFPFNDACF